MTARRAAFLAGGVMLAAYVLTLAPGVTFWDAGEFIASARVLGIPHPPGTPLFVVLLNVWARLLSFLPFAVATNLFSAVSTAVAVGLTAWLIARVAPSPWLGLAAITPGAMTSVWQNATETEVYAASLALAIGTLVAADAAGRTGERRWTILTAYLIALSVPLHLSALVAAPAAIFLAARRTDGRSDWFSAALLLGAAAAAFGVARLSIGSCIVSAVSFLVAAMMQSAESRTTRARNAAIGAVVTVIALSCTLFLLVRARHDPAINQGNPANWASLGSVIARRQYAVAGLWPRQAPAWLQVANWFEYADWQYALSLAPTVDPTWPRVAMTIAFAALGVFGMRQHRSYDRRTWAATTILFFSGSLGVLAYLNLKAGASFAWSFAPSDAAHEARDRDYFFVLGFWAWGIWAGLGAFALARRLRVPSFVGPAVAALPLVLNWSAVSRRAEPEASLPDEVAQALLDSLPRRAVLFVAGDNDSYPLWYAQQVEHRRQDVTVVTLPLLATAWYVDELARRYRLAVPIVSAAGLGAPPPLTSAHAIATTAAALGRPVAVSLTVTANERSQLNKNWKVIGVYAIVDSSQDSGPHDSSAVSTVARIDSAMVLRSMREIEAWRRGRGTRPSVDPVNEYFLQVLTCPALLIERAAKHPSPASLDSTCNLR